ncbi:hypothetical protein QTO34_006096 [Cnephaeus nilssonii]|uniref:Uncharacterized protein n=1 Tax=Cnephaeus nilssonii TaxID=3371016 RepID=A0AA40HMZ5_CNENI|nr:hypothetical protein QTO34_006096 [Eptesicus nilssonii]
MEGKQSPEPEGPGKVGRGGNGCQDRHRRNECRMLSPPSSVFRHSMVPHLSQLPSLAVTPPPQWVSRPTPAALRLHTRAAQRPGEARVGWNACIISMSREQRNAAGDASLGALPLPSRSPKEWEVTRRSGEGNAPITPLLLPLPAVQALAGPGYLSLGSNQPQHSLKPKPNPEQALTLFNSMMAKRGEEAEEEKLKANRG